MNKNLNLITNNNNSCTNLKIDTNYNFCDPYSNIQETSSIWQPLHTNNFKIIPHSNHNSKRQNLILQTFNIVGSSNSPSLQGLMPEIQKSTGGGIRFKPQTQQTSRRPRDIINNQNPTCRSKSTLQSEQLQLVKLAIRNIQKVWKSKID